MVWLCSMAHGSMAVAIGSSNSCCESPTELKSTRAATSRAEATPSVLHILSVAESLSLRFNGANRCLKHKKE